MGRAFVDPCRSPGCHTSVAVPSVSVPGGAGSHWDTVRGQGRRTLAGGGFLQRGELRVDIDSSQCSHQVRTQVGSLPAPAGRGVGRSGNNGVTWLRGQSAPKPPAISALAVDSSNEAII